MVRAPPPVFFNVKVRWETTEETSNAVSVNCNFGSFAVPVGISNHQIGLRCCRAKQDKIDVGRTGNVCECYS